MPRRSVAAFERTKVGRASAPDTKRKPAPELHDTKRKPAPELHDCHIAQCIEQIPESAFICEEHLAMASDAARKALAAAKDQQAIYLARRHVLSDVTRALDTTSRSRRGGR